MVSITFLILFTAFYVLYGTSKKMLLNSNFGIENWIHKNSRPAKLIGLLLLIIALMLHILYFGVGAGTLIFFIVLMTISSFIIILVPLKLINYKSILLLFILSLVIELQVL